MVVMFDGRKFAGELENELKIKVENLRATKGITPKLVDIVIGTDPASVLYANMKRKVAERVGMVLEVINFPKTVNSNEVITLIDKLNNDQSVHGILLQLPLPKLITNYQLLITNSINPTKDVDCLTLQNLDHLKTGNPHYLPATVKGILSLITNYKLLITNSTVCIVGSSGMVGRSLSDYLKSQGANILECDEFTKDISESTKQADILISATGVPGIIRKEMVKPGVAVIDVGSPVGDVDPEVQEIASFITPVPGGVGPMTIISLLENTLLAASA